MATGIEEVHGLPQTSRPALAAGPSHVGDVVVRVTVRDSGRTDSGERCLELVGRKYESQMMTTLGAHAASCNVISGLILITENGASSPSWTNPMTSAEKRPLALRPLTVRMRRSSVAMTHSGV